MSYNKGTNMYDGFIYCITNKINEKKYIGQTKISIDNRMKQHFSKSKNKRKYAINLAISKYGKDNFKVEEIEKVSCNSKQELEVILNEKEIYYIAKLKTLTSQHGYNIAKGGNGCSYFCYSVDVYDLMGNFINSFDGINECARHYDISENTIINMCKGKQNRSYKCDFIFRYKGDSFDKYDTTKLIPNSKEIYQFTLDGKFIKKYMCASEASKEINNTVCALAINSAARNNKTAGGYAWSYNNKFNFDIDNYRNYVAVDKYSLSGEFLGSYKSITDAGKSLNLEHVKTSCITDVCLGKQITAYGFIWRYKGEPFNKYKIKSTAYKLINQYTKDNIFVKTYDSAFSAAKEVGIKYSGDIGKCCKTGKWHCGGYKWFYANDPDQPDKSKIIA